MSVESVANDVDHDVLMEGVAVVNSEFEDCIDDFRFISVDVEDRRFNSFHNIGGVETSAVFLRGCREANLVVHDDVDNSFRGVSVQRLHLKTFVDNTLSGERGVTVHQHSEGSISKQYRYSVSYPCLLFALIILGEVLESSHAAHSDRVDSLEMRRVRENALIQTQLSV